VKKKNFNQNKIISASEIAQFNYCSNSWYLQRCGIKPEAPQLEIGTKKHKQLGDLISNIDSNVKKSKYVLIIGLILLIFGFFLYLSEVML
jgi:CRISPR/Cas system-associated exonuclease Cas4 (RecB family)